MAYTTVYASTADSYLTNTSTSSWADAQADATTAGSHHNNSQTAYAWSIYNKYAGGRGGNTWYCRRCYFPFDLSGESGTVESANLKIYMDNYGDTGDSDDVTIVEASALAGSTADFGNVYTTGTTWGDELANSISVSTTAGYHTFTLNADGISLLNNAVGSGTATIGLVGYYYDYTGHALSLNGDETRIYVRFANYSGTASDPKLEITYAEAAVAGNAIFFGHNF